MKNTLKNICISVMTLVLVLSMGACSAGTSEIETLTKNFETACNSLDLNGILDCVTPEISTSVKAVTGFIGMFSDKDSDEILEKVGSVIFKGLPENSREFFSSIKVDIDTVEQGEDKASAAARITYEISGEKHEKDLSLDYSCVDGKWYISNLDVN